ncbi:hypothetical protein GURASL_18630 [Geotalea uraniireducens]|uniref:DUF2059 domain-containing protein n=1 Tax=Geotalea uraniireducens TaxID=351604 RepID=A0ABM8ELP3_9BACT|nr:DUF2059 domain-containing protein [Geotalea uraniireducens]BDV42940.1 hypothetical protein GURASL_18630 [Geotalea uraniireducens]
MKKTIFIYAVAYLLTCSPVYAEEQQLNKMDNILKLIEITGVTKAAVISSETTSEDYYNQIKKVRPDISDQIIQILKEESKAVIKDSINRGEYAAKVAPVWAKNYTESEISELIKFYESPLGKKVVAVTPQMTKELLAAGEEWQKSLGEELANRVDRRLLKENIQLW